MSDLIDGDPAAERFAELLATIGETPLSSWERGLLVHVASWLSEAEVSGLCRVIKRSRDLAVVSALRKEWARGRDLVDRLAVETDPTARDKLIDKLINNTDLDPR